MNKDFKLYIHFSLAFFVTVITASLMMYFSKVFITQTISSNIKEELQHISKIEKLSAKELKEEILQMDAESKDWIIVSITLKKLKKKQLEYSSPEIARIYENYFLHQINISDTKYWKTIRVIVATERPINTLWIVLLISFLFYFLVLKRLFS